MNVLDHKIIRKTKSVCPNCLLTIPAMIYNKNEEVYMHKACPEHGAFDIYLWPDATRYQWFNDFRLPSKPRRPQTETFNECPLDCGLCPNHQRGITLPEIEVTWRCNLACPVCFASDGDIPPDPSLDVIERMLENICDFDGQDLPIQITGGEPTIRKDLPDIIALCGNKGFSAVELNTNGIVIGTDRNYLRKLKESGLTNVYLQFDGLSREITKTFRGQDLLAVKYQAIENCRKENVPVILSVTVVRGINDNEIGNLIRFSMENLGVIRGLALQAAFESGRFDVENVKHLSVGDIARLIEEQTDAKINFYDFWPVASSHPLCYGSTYLVGEGKNYQPITRTLQEDEYRRLYNSASPQGAFFQDMVANMSHGKNLPPGLPILIMEYMDAWTMDLERAQNCNLAVTICDGSSIPFCIYHLMDSSGKRLYPHGGKRHGRCS